MSREDISAIVDGEIAAHQLPAAFTILATDEGQASWELYHRIGDTLRSVDLANNISPAFRGRMAARLAAEGPLGAARRPLHDNASRTPASLADTPGGSRGSRGYAGMAPVAHAAAVLPVLRGSYGGKQGESAFQSGTPKQRISARQLTASMSAMGAALTVVAAAVFIANPALPGQKAERQATGMSAVHFPANLTMTHLGVAAHPAATSVEEHAAGEFEQADLREYVLAHQGMAPSLFQTANFVRTAPDTATVAK